MIRRLRRRHLRIVWFLSVLIPLLLAAGWFARRPPPYQPLVGQPVTR